MIEEINGWKVHPTNIAIGQYPQGPNEMLAFMAWKPEGYDRLVELNRIRRNRGMEPIGDPNTLIEVDPEYGSAGYHLLVDVNGKPTTVFLTDNREEIPAAQAAQQTSPQEAINQYIRRNRRKQA